MQAQRTQSVDDALSLLLPLPLLLLPSTILLDSAVIGDGVVCAKSASVFSWFFSAQKPLDLLSIWSPSTIISQSVVAIVAALFEAATNAEKVFPLLPLTTSADVAPAV